MTELKEALTRLAAVRRLLVAMDFDGVLAPIVDVPSAARPLPESASALGMLATLPDTTVALVSGRGLADLAAVSGFGAPIRLVGSHGAEFDDGAHVVDAAARARLERLVTEVTDLVGGEPGVRLEHKPTGVAVHVRGADPDVAERVLDAVRRGPAAADGVTVTPGKAVLDLAVVSVSKGSAIDRLRAQVHADAVLFVGDDVTDETAFARLRSQDVGVKVGDGETAARFRVPDPPAVAGLLRDLLAARSGGHP
ncbi:trehalose 6-phosphate phosphatase [Pseudonocardia thermophila]|jgi:trehalose-phosphatase|uniref:Trehalose 6-phosphate phosphatase n=1 Tax=Pseudonocardia thermophila TaxID=1848 RepID=A0A1M6UP54_PSETH|nr:trehalose-phosphatase [Pseudonocardia thermophila]SHK70941.1 trehalose 6-phosphate phosphatase [Pseudonocardia thermophila]